MFRRKKRIVRLPYIAVQLGPSLVQDLRVILAFAEDHTGEGHYIRVLHDLKAKEERITCVPCAGVPVVIHPGLATREEDELEF